MKLLEQEYKLIKNNKDCFNLEEIEEKITDYFKDYDYIVGDYAYSKLRIKGFTKKFNKLNRDINDFENVDKYIKENCAYGCKYFILEKIN